IQNLLRTLTASQVKSSLPESELKLLLSAVKETRRATSDAGKLADAFYDSLEGLLVDLRTVTMDNRDAEAFLKPVSKTEVPDYYDIIQNPMDLQTMLKKVKQRQYKSKKEFKDDLDLIWSNCFTYNATEVSVAVSGRGSNTSLVLPIRTYHGSVHRTSGALRDLPVFKQHWPTALADDHPLRQCATRLKAKAERLLQNITDLKERADPIIPGEVRVRGITPRINGTSINGNGRLPPGLSFRSPSPTKQSAPLPGQARRIQRDTTFPESSAIVRAQAGMTSFLELDREVETYLSYRPESGDPQPSESELKQRLLRYAVIVDDEGSAGASLSTIDGDVGAKRKLNGFLDDRPRKRARTQSPVDKEVVELWWDAMRSDEMIGNGFPSLVHDSSDIPSRNSSTLLSEPSRSSRRRKKKPTCPPNSLLYHMNNNIRTLRRVRTTHAKYSSLIQSAEDSGGFAPPPVQDIPEELDDVLDERPWKPPGAGLDLGAENADDCLHWMGSKVLEHAGFQGTSKMALDVLASVTAEYLFNVGRTIRFLCDKYGNKMTAEQIILHTLFESGITRINDLERYIRDDVVRYGGRLSELEKKLANAYREATAEEAWDDDALFRMEGEEEEGEFVMGNFAESFGEDFLGLKELGIADEFGLSSLTIPKRLLKGKGKLKEGPSAAKPTEPPPPFPPPPPFIPLDSTMVENQIGLLKPFYQARIAELSASIIAPPVPAPPSDMPPPPPFGAPALPSEPVPSAPGDAPVIILPDDAPSPSHAKIGPLGTVNKATPAASTAKKKSKAKPPAPGPGPGPAPPPPPANVPQANVGAMTPDLLEAPPPLMASSSSGGGDMGKKGKSGASSPSKKKAKVQDPFPPVVMASA
ncbi:Bromodomain-domain-containing protein, partial [Trametes coccinea BRFM310]